MTLFPGRACALGLTLALATTAASAGVGPTGSDTIGYMEGKAFAVDGHLMYTESHWQYDDGDGPSRLVLYRCPDGKPFARKTLHDGGNAQAPDFALDDGRSGYREGVRRVGSGRVVFVRADANATQRTAPLPASPMPVIDAGFDAYVSAHWDTIGKDGDVMPFLLPSRLGTLDFRIRRQADTRIGGRPARQYRLSLDSLIGFALPHLDVAYDAQTHQLLRFVGIANIRSSGGQNVRATIVFDPSNNARGSRTDREAAAAVPLDGRCLIP